MSKNPISVLIFGGTGDLTKRKLLPAFRKLEEEHAIPENSLLLGIGRSDFTTKTYKQLLLNQLPDCKNGLCIPNLNIAYARIDYALEETYKAILNELKKNEAPNTTQRIIYLATTYKVFPNIISNLHKAGLLVFKGKPVKIVFEKPFGSDYDSAKELEKSIHKYIEEDFIYRIDHYLGKETVQDLAVLTYTNPSLRALFHKNVLDKIEIIANETISVGDRIEYYDGSGAVKDMIQSHLLQLTALVTMNPPRKAVSEHIHNEKVAALKKIIVGKSNHVLGQYDSYKSELLKKGLKPSKTETYAKLCLYSKDARLKGVPIYLETGKALSKKEGKIILYFKKETTQEIKKDFQNKLIIHIHGKQDIQLEILTRKEGTRNDFEIKRLTISDEKPFSPNSSDGYHTLLRDIIQGHKSLFTRYDEVMESWRIIRDFEKLRTSIKVKNYKKGKHP